MPQDSPVAIGISPHAARAEVVTLTLEDGKPTLVDRRSLRTLEDGLPGMPYHHQCLELPLAEGEVLVAKVRASVDACTGAELARLIEDLQPRQVMAVCVRQKAPAHVPDALADILKSWPATCAADGEMYRRAVADASRRLGIPVFEYPRKGEPPAPFAGLAAALGKHVGPPWAKEHREAAAYALAALAGGAS